MILDFFDPGLLPSKRKERLIEEELYEKNSFSLSDEEISNVVAQSNEFYDQICKLDIEEQNLILIYSYLIQNIKYCPIPNEKCQNIIEQHAINIQNINIAELSMRYLSHFAQENTELESRILNNLNLQILHEYFLLLLDENSPRDQLRDDSILQFLKTFLSFSPNIAQFCLEKRIYSELYNLDDFEDDKLFYKLSLIKTTILTFNPPTDFHFLYEDAMDYLVAKIETGIQNIENQELICYCVSHCLLKMPDICTEKCIISLLRVFDWILPYWEIYLNKIDDKTISINFNISMIIFIISIYCPDRLNKRFFSRWIKEHFIMIPTKTEESKKEKEEEEIEDNYLKYETKIVDINIYLIGTLIFLLEDDSFNISYLFLPLNSSSDSPDYSLVDYIFDLIDLGNSNIKNISVQFFWKLYGIKNSRTRANYTYPYFANHNVVEKSIEYFEELDGIPLNLALKGIISIIDSLIPIIGSSNPSFEKNPLIIQIKTEENFHILQRVSLNNSDEETRNLANEILQRVFTSQNEE